MTNGDHRASFLAAVRRALGHPADVRRQAPPGLFPERPSPESRDRLERIARRRPSERRMLIDALQLAAEPIHLRVRVVASTAAAAAAIADEIAAADTEWGGRRQVCTWAHPLIDALDLPSALADRDATVVSTACAPTGSAGRVEDGDRDAWRRQVVDSFVGVTAADWCVADTATLVLRTRPGQPRSVSLVPSIHIAVIPAHRIVADWGELYAALRWENAVQAADLTTCMTFVSGPSKTADIEATLVHGAHGPRAVSLFVIEEE